MGLFFSSPPSHHRAFGPSFPVCSWPREERKVAASRESKQGERERKGKRPNIAWEREKKGRERERERLDGKKNPLRRRGRRYSLIRRLGLSDPGLETLIYPLQCIQDSFELLCTVKVSKGQEKKCWRTQWSVVKPPRASFSRTWKQKNNKKKKWLHFFVSAPPTSWSREEKRKLQPSELTCARERQKKKLFHSTCNTCEFSSEKKKGFLFKMQAFRAVFGEYCINSFLREVLIKYVSH